MSFIWFLCLLGLCDFDRDVYYTQQEDARAKAIEQELTKTTRLLCEAGKVFRGEKEPSEDLLAWFKEHEELDRRREEHE